MKIGIAQIASRKGDIEANISHHLEVVRKATALNADILIFPELSLTGYEPTIASELATTIDDSRLEDLQKVSDQNEIIVGVGLPIKHPAGITISMVILHPHQPRQEYAKAYLHEDENPFFVPGDHANVLVEGGYPTKLGLAICYEISVKKHIEKTAFHGIDGYLASVAKTKSGVANAERQLARIAYQYQVHAFMSNAVGLADGDTMNGKSAIWAPDGKKLGQLNTKEEGLLVLDIKQNVLKQTIIK